MKGIVFRRNIKRTTLVYLAARNSMCRPKTRLRTFRRLTASLTRVKIPAVRASPNLTMRSWISYFLTITRFLEKGICTDQRRANPANNWGHLVPETRALSQIPIRSRNHLWSVSRSIETQSARAVASGSGLSLFWFMITALLFTSTTFALALLLPCIGLFSIFIINYIFHGITFDVTEKCSPVECHIRGGAAHATLTAYARQLVQWLWWGLSQSVTVSRVCACSSYSYSFWNTKHSYHAEIQFLCQHGIRGWLHCFPSTRFVI